MPPAVYTAQTFSDTGLLFWVLDSVLLSTEGPQVRRFIGFSDNSITKFTPAVPHIAEHMSYAVSG
jgi:hypothetical protein